MGSGGTHGWPQVMWGGTWTCLATQQPFSDTRTNEAVKDFSSFWGRKGLFFRGLSLWTSEPNPLGIIAASPVQSRQLQSDRTEGESGSFSAVILKCWILPLEWGAAHFPGYPGAGSHILLSASPPSTLHKHRCSFSSDKNHSWKIQWDVSSPSLSPSRFCCILDKLELHRGGK